MDRFDLMTYIVFGVLIVATLLPLGPWSFPMVPYIIITIGLFFIALVLGLIGLDREEARENNHDHGDDG